MIRRTALAALVGLLVLAPACQAAAPAKIGHVFVIVLENEDAGTTFGPDSPAPYLATTLRRAGRASSRTTTASAHNSLDNYIAMVSGQAPNAADAGRLPGLHRLPARAPPAPTARSSGRAASIRASVQDRRRPARGQAA